MKVLLAFGSEGYERGLAALGQSARPYFDHIRLLGPADIDARFRAENARVLSCPRGAGYWLWKPYFIRQALAAARDGDFVFYSDALACFVDTPAPLFPLCAANGGIMLFNQHGAGWKNDRFTRMDCFQLMGAASERYFHGDNLNAAFQLYQKTPRAVAFVEELLAWCRNYDVVSDAPNTTGGNLPGFVDHRHDQSILSILAIRHGLRTFKDISQFGTAVAEDFEFGQIVFHHRERDPAPAPGPLRSTVTKTIARAGRRLAEIVKTQRAKLKGRAR